MNQLNPIYTDILNAKQGHYVHALEVNDVHELKACIDALGEEFEDKYKPEDVTEFLTSLNIYSLAEDEDTENEINEFNVSQYIIDTF